jgi:hypothetical protein
MAAPGTYAAWQQLRPLEGSVADDLKDREMLDGQRRAQDREDNKIRLDQENKISAEKQALIEKFASKLKRYDTGSKSLNEVVGRGIAEAQEAFIPVIKTLTNRKATDEEKIKANIVANNLGQAAENLKIVTDFYTSENEEYKAGLSNDSLFQEPTYENKFQNGFDKYQIVWDENGLPGIAFRDTNGDGVVDVESFENIKAGVAKTKFQKKYNLENIATDAAKTLGTKDITKEKGLTDIQIKEAKQKELEAVSRKLFINGDGTATDVSLSELRKQNLENTPENLEKIRQYFVDKVMSMTDYTEKNETDNAAAASNARLTEDQRQFNLEYDLKQKAEARAAAEAAGKTKQPLNFADMSAVAVVTKVGSGTIDPVSGKTIPDKMNGMKGAIGFSIPGANMERKIGDDKSPITERVQTFYLLPKGGIALAGTRTNGVVEAEGTDGKAKGAKSEEFVYKTTNQADVVADFITKELNPETGKYFRTVKEFEALMRKQQKKQGVKATGATSGAGGTERIDISNAY